MNRFGAVAAVLFAVTMWGLVPVATRFLLTELSPATVLILRLVPAGMIAAIIAVFLSIRPIAREDWARILIASLLGNVGYQVLAHFGMKTVPAIWTGMLFGLEPVFIALFAVILLGDRLTLPLIAGMLIAFAGTGVLVFGSAAGIATDVGLGGLLLVTLSTMGWGIYTVVLRPAAKRYGSFETSCLTLAISAFPMTAFLSPAFPTEVAVMSLVQVAVSAFMVILATFGAVVAWNYGSARMPSALAGMFLYVQPLVAAAGGSLILGERLSWPVLCGGGLILLGVAVSQVDPRRWSHLTRSIRSAN